MKKVFLFLIIIFFFINVSADITDSQSEKVVAFAKNFIVKGLSSEHLDSKGMPILAYRQGPARVYGYQEILTFVKDDYRGMIEINNDKWNFDCSSYVSYVLKKTLNLKLISSGYLGGNPYVVSDFVKDDKNFIAIGNRNGMSADETYNLRSQLKPGDLIIIKGLHIGMYLGNDEMAEATTLFIGKYNDNWKYYRGDGLYNLGLGISYLNDYIFTHQTREFIILRIKDGIVNPDIVPNTTIIWPDNGKIENLVEEQKKSDPPKDQPSLVKIILSNVSYADRLTMKVELHDENGITEYKLFHNDKLIKGEKLDKVNNGFFEYEITENGQYAVVINDALENEMKKEIDIENIDKNPPTINKVYYENGFINVDAKDDEAGLNDNPYSYDDCKTWTFKKQKEIKENGEYHICVRDKLGNITKSIKVVDEIKKEVNNPVDDNNDKKKDSNIIFVFIVILLIIIGIFFGIKRKKMTNVPDDYE